MERQYRNLPDTDFHWYIACASLLYLCMALIEALVATRSTSSPPENILGCFYFRLTSVPVVLLFQVDCTNWFYRANTSDAPPLWILELGGKVQLQESG